MAVFRAAEMLTQKLAVEIQVLNRQGRSNRQIARETGLSRNTVRRYLREGRPIRYGPREPRVCMATFEDGKQIGREKLIAYST